MDDQAWWTEGVDLTKPSSARVYDVHLGGSHNLQIDREVAEEAARIMPSLPDVLRANRSFLRRAVQFLVSKGITQFLDLGSGIPTVGNVHEVAQSANPRCRVVYVDKDLVAVAHSKAILRDNDQATAIRADLRRPDEVLTHRDVTSMLDFSQPIAVLLLAVLHFVEDDDDPAGIVARYVDALVPGSYLTISHARNDEVGDETKEAGDVYSKRIGGFWPRSRARVTAMFAGLNVVEPGVVEPTEWHPESPGSAQRLDGWAGVAMKP